MKKKWKKRRGEEDVRRTWKRRREEEIKRKWKRKWRKRKKNERRRVENKQYYFQEKEDEQNLFKETVPSTPEMTTNMDAHHAPGLKFDRELYADAFIPNCLVKS